MLLQIRRKDGVLLTEAEIGGRMPIGMRVLENGTAAYFDIIGHNGTRILRGACLDQRESTSLIWFDNLIHTLMMDNRHLRTGVTFVLDNLHISDENGDPVPLSELEVMNIRSKGETDEPRTNTQSDEPFGGLPFY